MTAIAFERSDEGTGATAKAVGVWLLIVALLVFAMVIVGGLTRLTDSGLSMVEWRPVTGWLPPLSDAAWLAEFEKYRAFPEYQKINRGMSLDEFKFIYYWEYGHRLFGRVIGLAFALPFLWFLVTGRIGRALAPRLVLLFALGGAQGALGWFMVKSGLVDHPDVSHYRLTAHLGLAVVILAALVWTALDILRPRPALIDARAARAAAIAVLAIFLQLLSGGLVAGLDAGYLYNTWPDMNGGLAPEDWLRLQPWWLNFLENPGTVQFLHRIGAYLTIAVVVWAAWSAWRQATARPALRMMIAALAVQVALGLATLLLVVPVPLASAHQAGALLLLLAAVNLRHRLGRRGAA